MWRESAKNGEICLRKQHFLSTQQMRRKLRPELSAHPPLRRSRVWIKTCRFFIFKLSMLLGTEENVNYEFILPAKKIQFSISHSANGKLNWAALRGPNVIGSSAMHVIGQACVCWWILLLLCIITRSGKAGSRRLPHSASFGLTAEQLEKICQ